MGVRVALPGARTDVPIDALSTTVPRPIMATARALAMAGMVTVAPATAMAGMVTVAPAMAMAGMVTVAPGLGSVSALDAVIFKPRLALRPQKAKGQNPVRDRPAGHARKDRTAARAPARQRGSRGKCCGAEQAGR
jgi:hypothetical protein